MPSLPPLDIKKKINHAPHVVILGAGASLAAFPNGDLFGRKLPLMRNLVEIVGLEPLLKSYDVTSGYEDFESLYNNLADSGGYGKLQAELEDRIRSYFSVLRLPSETTIYDLLLLSLREKDVIATFNWDPFLAEAFKRNRIIKNLPGILFLHGNVDAGACIEHLTKGFLEHRCSFCGKPLEPTPLLFPVKRKDYTSNPFIKNEWDELQWYLEHAYLITIFGYSAPSTDVEARNLILNKWQVNKTRDLAEIEIVDVRPREEVEANWSDFFVRQHYGIFDSIDRSLSFMYVRRSCEAFAMATLQQAPWKENRYPISRFPKDIHEWLRPLLEEEVAGQLTGNPCARIIPESEQVHK